MLRKAEAQGREIMNTKQVLRRRTEDNVYLHPDFHGALNQA